MGLPTYEDRLRAVRRERETERQIRDMDIHEVVELVHNLEDRITELEHGRVT